MNKENKNLIIVGFVIILGLLSVIGYLSFSRKQNALADSTRPVVLGDVPSEDNKLINIALDDFVNTSKDAEKQLKELEEKLKQKVMQKQKFLNDLIVKTVTTKGVTKDFSKETIIEKDPKPDKKAEDRIYQFVEISSQKENK